MAEDGAFKPDEHLIQVQGGKDYLPALWRVRWLRDQYADAFVGTEVIRLDDEVAVFKATVTLPTGGSATGHGSCLAQASARFAGRYIEKAETAAVARALALLGFGTQFASDDFDEQPEGADAGVPPRTARPKQAAPPNSGTRSMTVKYAGPCAICGEVIPVGAEAIFSTIDRKLRHPDCATAEPAATEPVGATPPAGDPEREQISEGQIKAIRASLKDMFGNDERSQCEWMAIVMPTALNERQTEIHLSSLNQREAAHVLKALNEERTRRRAK